MKADQIAYYVHNEHQAAKTRERLGLTLASDWVEDVVAGKVRLGLSSEWTPSKAHLRFCYDYGTEIEILTYLEGDHWHARYTDGFRAGEPFLSHIGYHLEPGEDWPSYLADETLVQEMLTERHTNPYLLQRGRTYHYRIYDTRPTLGVYSKFIKRIEEQRA